MKIGYARVSTREQNLDLQMDALKSSGCEKIFTDKVSGAKKERPGLKQVLEYARKGDIVVVWKLDRAGRSLKHLIEIVNGLNNKGVGFISLKESLDTTSSTGKLMFHIFASLAEFERDIIRERTLAGLSSARARGRVGGRPPVMDTNKIAMAKSMMADKSISVKDICKALSVSKSTLYKYLNENKKD
ncbi:Site-specific DNA recombinase [Peptoclostridium litorale DSM 5388]|uniref:DNA-invertase ResR n=1 Tax=Peptoclostridium litorale DSM 5388 TaxID=1121324 RepID=A0A069RL33_PEPLI|nr:recombinase family protein [Peptoclostridium litorale]KDR96820.1 DNA-invertase ResR [Peptoclostridium litorale DSM 5388]SIO36546.1 Site-specific DNA recombinase [Peptoclostridium litorale DSM 5388]